MTRDEALKKWKEEVADWKIASGFDRNMKVSYYAMSTFVRILDALITPETPVKYSTQQPDHVGSAGTISGFDTEKSEKSTDDLWLEFVNRDFNVCSLCGNSGYIDTNNTAFMADGCKVGKISFCICPNGRSLKEQNAMPKDDGWKPWPPEDWNDIKGNKFEVSSDKVHTWPVEIHSMWIRYNMHLPMHKMKWWRQ